MVAGGNDKILWQDIRNKLKQSTAHSLFALRDLQPCVNGDWLLNVRGQFSTPPPHKIHTPWLITKKLLLVITSATLTAVPNLVQIRIRGAFWANGWNIMNFKKIFNSLYLFLGTHLQVRPIDGFSGSTAQTTRTRVRVCLLGFRWYCSPFWGKIPPNPQIRRRE